jgi:polysaccharide biosynthesis transport protein
MNDMQSLPAAAAPSLTPNDLLYVFFRHKWKILICTTIGLLTAVGLYLFHPPPFQSEAMLFIRYVLEENSSGMPGNDSKAVSPDQRGDTIINTEVQILSSMDIAEQVADAVGPAKILSKVKGPKDRERAAGVIQQNLTIEPLPKSSVIRLVFKSADATLVQPVLTAVVDAYQKKHIEVHRAAGAAGDFLAQETDQLRSQLSQTEDGLRKAKDKAGIISLEDSKKVYTEQVATIQQDIYAAEAELAERSTIFEELAKRSPSAAQAIAAKPSDTVEPTIPASDIEAYRNAVSRLEWLQKNEQQLLAEFTEQNQRVKDIRTQIAVTEDKKKELETKYPSIPRVALTVASSPGSAPNSQISANTLDLAAESAHLSGLQSKIKVLNSELDQIRKEAGNVDQMEGSISDLQRQKELEEANYRYYAVHLEANRIDEALGSGRAVNIAEIQTPTPPGTDVIKEYKILGGIAAAGIILGIGWAFLIEFYLDHTIRRPRDVERIMHAPLFLSIPDFGRNGHNRHVFHETLRDRLIGYFESQNLTHKPKLLAVTGVGRKAGVTTTAAGLAKCLSETGEGNVLLVDMTISQGSAQQFYKGTAACGMDQLLDTRNTAMVQDKLYVVGAEPKSDKLSRALPTRFSQLVPQLKASDFDYIIFDMPAVNQISITPRLAGFMDMVLLVVESEQTDREIARQAAELLASSRAHVGVVLNKSKNYLPSRVHHDFLGSS